MRAAREFGSDPVAVARFSYDTAGLFLRAGNFRPLGRFAEQAERAFAVEAAEATGLSLHSVQGLVRLVLVAALAMAAAQIVSAVMRSAGTAATAQPLLALYSLALGTTLVASHHLSNLTAFPVVLIGSPLLILAIALAVGEGRRHGAPAAGMARARDDGSARCGRGDDVRPRVRGARTGRGVRRSASGRGPPGGAPALANGGHAAVVGPHSRLPRCLRARACRHSRPVCSTAMQCLLRHQPVPRGRGAGRRASAHRCAARGMGPRCGACRSVRL